MDFTPSHEPLLRPAMPELDTLRGVAVLGVLFYHGIFWSRDLSTYSRPERFLMRLASPGEFGVSLFFVLSGFLITGVLIDSRNRADYFRRFYVRRALRILPAYYGILAVLAALGLISHGFLLLSFFYCSNLALLFGATWSYGVLWSLSVEEHFYLLWPTVVRKMSNRQVAALAGGIVVMCPMLRLICFFRSAGVPMESSGCSFYTWNMADGLATGAILAVLVREMNGRRVALRWICLVIAAIATSLAAAGLPFGLATRMSPVGAALQFSLANFCFALLLGAFLLLGTSPWKRIATPWSLRFFGNISYGLYLLHPLGLLAFDKLVARTRPSFLSSFGALGYVWLRFLCAATASVLCAYVSRWYFEEPFLRLKSRLTTPSGVARQLAATTD
jgi:peptidoglycan/LPS O-acetylase OafA/YrhL